MKEKEMPAKSKAQQRLMAIAKHSPEKVYAENKGVLGMSKKSLSEFASTPRKELPEKTPKYEVLNKLQSAAGKVKKKVKKTQYLVKNKLSEIMEGKGIAFLDRMKADKNSLYWRSTAEKLKERKALNKKYLKKN